MFGFSGLHDEIQAHHPAERRKRHPREEPRLFGTHHLTLDDLDVCKVAKSLRSRMV
jgi:hypothetical protein